MDERFIGGFHTQPPSSPLPPPLPPKDYVYHAPQHQYQQQPHQSTISTSQLAQMSAVERSQTLRIARMDPHLQVCSPYTAYSICLISVVHVRSSS